MADANIVNNDTAPYQCEIQINFPSLEVALMAKDVLSVDDEVGNKTWKTFSISSKNQNIEEDSSVESTAILTIYFHGIEAKSLRVSISSFYDLLTVFLKCHQEFGGM